MTAGKLIELRETCRRRNLPVYEPNECVYRSDASILVQRDSATLANSYWLQRLPVRRRGKHGAAMYTLPDIARALVLDQLGM
jgi:hypothetical protein